VKVLGVWREVPISGSRDERIAAVASRQRGRIASRQLRAIAVSPSSATWLVSQGRLFPSLRCVFSVGHNAPVELGAETEALLSVREGAALSHWSAAALWGLWTPAPAETDVTVVRTSKASSNPGVRVHRSRILQSKDVRIRRGLPVTSPARTLLDIAPTATDRQLELAFDRGIVERVLRPAEVAELLSRAGGHPGRRRLATILERETSGTTMTRSDGEERMLALMRAARLPAPVVNAKVAGHEVDFYWPDHRFAVEVDGWRFHSGRRAFEDDRRKDQDLRRAGIDTMRTTGRQLKEQAYALIASVAVGLARSAATTAAGGGEAAGAAQAAL
jgi:very-short-patch-repair endonuclease/predicted transcriptional regulator of viral defense system